MADPVMSERFLVNGPRRSPNEKGLSKPHLLHRNRPAEKQTDAEIYRESDVSGQQGE